jgi:hypothetical protein
MECPTANALFDDYSSAAVEYFEAVDKLCRMVGSRAKFANAKTYANQMHMKCRTARSALDMHRAEHCCSPVPDFLEEPRSKA